MTDTERNRTEAICKVARVKNIEDLSDGFHTFKQLYFQRMMLFAVIVKQNKDKAWKSLRHEDGELCFGGGWFIVGVDTPEGSYTYHYEAKYFDLFDCDILDYGKHWDGHTEKDVTRLLSLTSTEPHWIPVSGTPPEEGERVLCTHLGGLNPNRQVIEHIYQNGKFVLGWDMDMNPSSPTFGQRYMGKVIAWMTMPSPYQEEGEEE